MARKRRPRGDASRDEAPRTAAERELLDEFTVRRAAVDDALAASNILHSKHLCPCCGLPTLDERGDYESCVICLWEDGTNEADPRRVSPPNYIALERARIDVAAHLRAFESARGARLLDAGVDPLVRSIKRFQERLRRGEATVDREDFAANLAQILAFCPHE
ncbi:hypothetical protein DB30_02733 [Enhygromyxa salina]|uniref:Cysteine-rich CPCC domain-containing protein n=1 Tax=Enhygromyxa salina TaxID=215803 RepID=A0A0C2DIF6_9BACT|nr:CPCC family cysteine-rich protein [Enhygromyxa salina]KIG19452.1 hypothetical protein DB30_02733 [Enhygromyxa salina]